MVAAADSSSDALPKSQEKCFKYFLALGHVFSAGARRERLQKISSGFSFSPS
jgi:hypothetical protein